MTLHTTGSAIEWHHIQMCEHFFVLFEHLLLAGSISRTPVECIYLVNQAN